MLSKFSRIARQVALSGALAGAFLAAPSAWAKDYLVTASHSGKVFVFDAAERKLVKEISVPGGVPLGVQPSPDGKVVYILNDQLGALHGMDIETGKEVFSASLSQGDIRGRGFAAMTISPDGKELFVTVFRTRLKKTEYEVLDPVIQVYSTDAGPNAQPVRSLPTPRQTMQIHSSTDGSKLFVIGPDITIMDPKTGKKLGSYPIRTMKRPNMSAPDVFGVWSQYSQANVWVNPTFSQRTDLPPTNPEAFKTGMMRLDLATGKIRMDDYENTANVIFSAVVNPVNKDEVFSVYTQLSRVDMKAKKLVKRVELDHTYYAINISSDGKELYLGGTLDDIAIYNPETLEKIGEMKIPDGSDMSAAWLQIMKRD